MDFEIFEPANGIRCIYQTRPSTTVHVGLLVNAGSRDEPEGREGLAHFIEHALFKGTKKRKAFHVLNRLETVGAELNAFTTKEITCVYASSLVQDFSRSLELIRDIVFDSVFPEKELEKEKDVIIEEIQSYLDNPFEMIFDEFESQLFRGHSFGGNILGTPGSVERFTRQDVLGFVKRNYHTGRMVISIVGGISPNRIRRAVEKYFGSIPAGNGAIHRTPPSPGVNFSMKKKKSTNQVHVVLGGRAYPLTHPAKTTMLLLNNMLGGPTMNNRLTLNLREKRGLAYHTESHYTAYSDAGFFQIYLGADVAHYEKAVFLAEKELKKFREEKTGTRQLSSAKKQLKGQIALAQESGDGVMLGLGKSYLINARALSLREIFARIDRITAGDLLHTANEVFNPGNLSRLIYY